MKKRLGVFVFLSLILIFGFAAFVSASPITDFLNKLTGKVTENYNCTDTDGGENYYLKGHLIDSLHSADYWDFCSGNTLREHYCGSINYLYTFYNCTWGCSEGACFEQPQNQTNQTNYSCRDSDGGFNYNAYGEVFTQGNSAPSIIDVCSGSYLYEGYCVSSGGATAQKYLCRYGCSEGACLPQPQNQTNPTCTDSDNGKNYYTKGNITYVYGYLSAIPNDKSFAEDYCSNFTQLQEVYCFIDSSGKANFGWGENNCLYGCSNGACLQQPQNQTNQTNATCTDTDGGRNYYLKGSSTDSTKTLIEGCVGNTSDLREFYCGEDKRIYSEDYTCPHGCLEGSCAQDVVKKYCSVDATKCNLEWTTPVCGTVVLSGIGIELCEVPGVLSSQVSAGFSFDNSHSCAITLPCPYGCSSGACVQPENQTNQTCAETDGGINYYLKGNVLDIPHGNANYWDYCILPTNSSNVLGEGGTASFAGEFLVEYYCGEKNYQYKSYKCPNGCKDGACVQAGTACVVNADCGENYKCINGFCIKAGAQCAVNADCVSGEICSNNICINAPVDYPVREMCIQTGGEWKVFSNGCADYCEFVRGNIRNSACTQVMKESCDCGTDMCWTGGACELNNLSVSIICESSCLLDKKCYPMGYRKAGRYCSENLEFVEQTKSNGICDNNFECKSNLCIDSQCISQGLMRKLFDWLRGSSNRNR